MPGLWSTIVDSSVDYFVSIRCFVYKNVKEMTSSNVLLCSRPKDIQFTVTVK